MGEAMMLLVVPLKYARAVDYGQKVTPALDVHHWGTQEAYVEAWREWYRHGRKWWRVK